MNGQQMTEEELMRALGASEPEGFVTTDWEYDVIQSLTLLYDALSKLEADPGYAVKWSLIAAHSAATSALASHLSGSYGIGALEKRDFRKARQALDEGLMLPSKEHMASFSELLKRATSADEKLEPIGGAMTGPLRLTSGDGVLLERLNTLRNRYIHFRFGGWSLQIAYAIDGVAAGLRLTDAINDYGWGLVGENSEKIAEQVKECSAILKEHSA